MSGPTGATARPERRPKRRTIEDAARFADKSEPNPTLKLVSERIKAMTPDEFRRSLLAAGIIGRDGKLTAPYADTPEK